jgi:Ca2+-binding EF-hand superfamily protein
MHPQTTDIPVLIALSRRELGSMSSRFSNQRWWLGIGWVCVFLGSECAWSAEPTKNPAALPARLAVVEAVAVEAEAAVVEVTVVESNAAPSQVRVTNAAGQQAVVVQRNPYTQNFAIRQEVDPQDAVERFLLLTPGAPLVIEATMTLDGQPFRIPREKLIDEMLAAADKDQDGKVTWEEALQTPRFTFGRYQLGNPQQAEQYIKNFDTNNDKLVDRAEARLFVAQFGPGGDFAISTGASFSNMLVQGVGGRVYNTAGATVDLLKLLDTDTDGALSATEIAAAGTRLKSRDANDDDLLYAQEIAGNPAAGPPNRGAVAMQPPAMVVLLGPTTPLATLFSTLKDRYKDPQGNLTAASFAALPSLVAQLDQNKNAQIDESEISALNEIAPHVKLAINLGERGAAPPIAVTHVAEELATAAEKSADEQSLAIHQPGFKLTFMANTAQQPRYNYDAAANQMIKQYDKDSNGYLEKEELIAGMQRQFELWDEDGDGKVYAKEITASYDRMQAPQMSQIRGMVSSLGNSVFQTLDETGDGRLSLREMRTAAVRLLSLDKNNDGRVTADEVPEAIQVTFGRGYAGYGAFQVQQLGGGGFAAASGNSATSRGPEWFTRMDRNGDGDVTLKEFLGDEQQFQQLDTNRDGFIERREAETAEQK